MIKEVKKQSNALEKFTCYKGPNQPSFEVKKKVKFGLKF
jgi:hypothetical protein